MQVGCCDLCGFIQLQEAAMWLKKLTGGLIGSSILKAIDILAV